MKNEKNDKATSYFEQYHRVLIEMAEKPLERYGLGVNRTKAGAAMSRVINKRRYSS